MIRIPSTRKRKKPEERLNLVPIMDSVFIFIFFLLMSANFIKIFEINSDVPIISDAEPPKDQKDPLALTLTVEESELVLSKGIPSKVYKKFPRLQDGQYDLESLHTELVSLKKSHLDEETIIFEPVADLSYEEIVKIMDALRLFKKTDDAIFKTNKDGLDEKIKNLFSKIIFSNLMS